MVNNNTSKVAKGAALLGISAIKVFVQRSGYYSFAFYSWGAALFAFILYLTVV